jgi:hypothetical protein
MTARTSRDWRGIKTPLSRCSNDELVGLLGQSLITAQRIRRFAGALEAELTVRAQETTDFAPCRATPTTRYPKVAVNRPDAVDRSRCYRDCYAVRVMTESFQADRCF